MNDQNPIKPEEQASFHDYAVYSLGQSLEGGLDVATKYAQQLVSMEEGSGLAFAEFLHGVNFRWKDFDKEPDDNFQKWAVRATGRSAATIQRRVCVWEFLSGGYIPAEYRRGIESFSLKMLTKAYRVAVKHKKNKYIGNLDLLPVDYEMGEGDWLALSECIDEATLGEVLDRITGREPNSNRVAFRVDDNGDIWFYKGKNYGVVIGHLNRDNPSQTVQDGISELLNRANIGEQNEY